MGLQQHRTGLAKKIWNLESPDDIAKWINERKKLVTCYILYIFSGYIQNGKNCSVSYSKMLSNSAYLLIKFLIDYQNIYTSMIRMSSK